jgi:hypothetical protein
MSHHNKKVLESVFAHPISSNIDFKDMEHALISVGVSIEEKAANKISLSLDGRSIVIHRPHQHTLSKDEVATVRGFLIDCGITPDKAV